MLFSCKISNSVLIFLEEKGVDTSDILDATSLPEEFLRDTSYWMRAEDMEGFLGRSQAHFQKITDQALLMWQIGHRCSELRAWGVLDSVLRMMPRPQEILGQPERFLSYFISPSPPIAGLVHSESSVAFETPVSADQYPLSTAFLAAAFEGLPRYAGQDLAKCSWAGFQLRISWQEDQENMFNGQEPGRQISPELMRNVLSSLEKHSRELEEKNRELQAKNEILMKSRLGSVHDGYTLPLQTEVQAETKFLTTDYAPLILAQDQTRHLEQQLARLQDYMVRAQQLVTMLVAQGRMNSQVKEAMRRVDWERVCKQFPQAVEDCRQILNSHVNAPQPFSKGETHV